MAKPNINPPNPPLLKGGERSGGGFDLAVSPAQSVTLLQPHTHAGRDYPPGSQLTLDADSAAWLIRIGSAERL